MVTGRLLKSVLWAVGSAALALVTGCNLFTPFATSQKSPDYHIVEGQKYLQVSEYSRAREHFSKALNSDSSKSLAYLGLSKSILQENDLSAIALTHTLVTWMDQSEFPYIDNLPLLNRIYTSNLQISGILEVFLHRDSLGQMDKVITTRDILMDYTIATTLSALLSILDFNGNKSIDSEDFWFEIFSYSEFSTDLFDSLYSEDWTVQRELQFNQVLENSARLFFKSGNALDLWGKDYFPDTYGYDGDFFTKCLESDSCDPGENRIIQETVALELGEFLVSTGFEIDKFKMKDSLDNDLDGCSDEEYLDGIDNDGDGLIDEDTRGKPDSLKNVRYLAVKDGVDNDNNGKIDNSGESIFDDRYTSSLSEPWVTAFKNSRGQIYWEFYRDDSGNPARKDKRIRLEIPPIHKLDPGSSILALDLCQH